MRNALIITLATMLCLTANLLAQAPARARVGLLISKLNAAVPLEQETTGYLRMTRVLAEIRDESIEIVPIVDPGTTSDAIVLAECRKVLPDAAPIDGADKQAIAKLDVIVSSHMLVVDVGMLDAIDAAVQNGTGLYIRMYFGLRDPGMRDAQVLHLNGLLTPAEVTPAQADAIRRGETVPVNEPRFVRSGDVSCRLLNHRAILGKLSDSEELVSLSPNGMYGTCTGASLIEVVDPSTIPNSPKDATISLLYTGRWGRGSIVAAPISGSHKIPRALELAGANRLGVRVIQWLAQQKKESTGREPAPAPILRSTLHPTTHPASQPGAKQPDQE